MGQAAVLHVDLDQFIVAVELLRRPELRGQPVLVGGTGDPTRRGVVAGASYEARASGARSGTPLRTAAARCPDAVFLPLDRPVYEAASAEFLAALREVAPVVEPAGWDEAYALAGPGDPEQFARRVQRVIRDRTRLESSVGIGGNKLHAKIASGLAKPAGVFRLDEANWQQVMAGRPAAALPGVGSKTTARLAAHGIGTVGELATADLAVMAAEFGPTIGPALVATARGLDNDPVRAQAPAPRSRGRELTFQENLTDGTALRWHLRRLAEQVAADLAADGELARRVVVKIRQAPFLTSSHGVTLTGPTRDPAALARAALAAFAEFGLDRPVRLVGVRAEVARPSGERAQGERAHRERASGERAAMAEYPVELRADPSLWLFLAPRHRRPGFTVLYDGTSSLGHLVESVGIPLPEVGGLRIGGAPAGPVQRVPPGEPVTVLPVARPQPLPPGPPRFCLDVHLGTLARRLRLLGLDTWYRNDAGDDELIEVAATGGRMLLTRDRGLLRRRAVQFGAYVRGDRPDDQLADVLDRFAPPIAPWTRCPACNGPLAPVAKTEVEPVLQPGTRRTYQEFARCQACGRAYWRGAHARRLAAVIDRARRLLAAGAARPPGDPPP